MSKWENLETRVMMAITPPVLVYNFEDSAAGTAVNNTGSGGDAYDGTLAGDTTPTFETTGASPAGGQFIRLDADESLPPFKNTGGRVDSATLLNPILGGSGSVASYIRTSYIGHGDAWQSAGVTGAEQAGAGNDIFWSNIDNNGRVRMQAGDGAAARSNIAINDSTWHHVVSTRDSVTGQERVYVEGILRGSAVGETGVKGAQFSAIGATTNVLNDLVSPDGFNYMDADLDQVQIYGSVLTPQEVAQLYAVPTTAAPAAPTGVTGTSTGPGSNTLTIPAAPAAEGVAGYVIFAGTNAAGPFTQIGIVGSNGTNPTTFIDRAVTAGATKYYVVQAFNSTGSSGNSAPATAVTTAASGEGVTAQYYNVQFWGYGNRGDGTNPTNRVAPNPDVRTFVPNVDFDYGGGTPDARIFGDEHSTVFTGKIVIPADANGNATPGETISVQFVSNTDDDGFLYVEDATGAQVLVSTDPGGHGQRDATTLTPIDVKEGQSYDFVMLQSEGGGGSGVHIRWDNPATSVREALPSSMFTTAMDVPAAPALGAPTENTAAQVVFPLTDNSSNETRFDLYRDGKWVGSAPINATEIRDTGPTAGNHSYVVRAVNTDGASAASAAQAVTVEAAPATGAAGHYYNSPFWGLGRGGNYGGRPADAVRVLAAPGGDLGTLEPNVDRDYGSNAPDPLINTDFHSTVWTGKITMPDDGDATAGETFTVRFIGNTDDHGFYYVNGQLVAVANYPRGQGDYTDAPTIDLKEGQSYDFVIFHAEQGGGSGVHLRWVNPVTGATEAVSGDLLTPRSGAPAAPTGINTNNTQFASQALLRWTDNATSEVRYEVRRSTNADMSGATTVAYLPVNSTAYTDTGLTKSTTYYYQVAAVNFEGDGVSTPAFQYTTLAVDVAPAAPGAVVAYPRPDGVHFCFPDNANNEERFVIQRKLATDPDTAFADVGTIAANAPGTTGTIFGVDTTAGTAGANYVYRIFAENATGRSPASPTVAVTATPPGGTGLRATYFDERFFEGTTVVVTPENAANTFGGGDLFSGGGGGGGVTGLTDGETFSAILEGYVVPEFTDNYTFYTNSDDGIDFTLIDTTTGTTVVAGPANGINFLRGMGGGFIDNLGTVPLVAGRKYIMIGRFSENTGGAGFRFGWSSPCIPQEVLPNSSLFPAADDSPLIAPGAVRGVALCNEKINLSFTDLNFSETGYDILRGTSPGGPFVDVGDTGPGTAGQTLTFSDTGPLAINTTYYYQVRAKNGAGNGPASAAIAVTTTDPATTDTNLTLTRNAAYVTVPATVDDDGQALRLTDNVNDQSGAAFLSQARPVDRDFTTEFTFQLPEASSPPADGFAFVIQSNGPTTLGGGGGGLGSAGVPNSFAIKFDTYNLLNQTGVYINGAMDDAGTDLGFELANGHRYKATVTYNADASGDDDAVRLQIVDLDDPTVNFDQTFTTDAPGSAFDMDTVLGADCGFVGFTGATGGLNQEQLILDWSFNGQNIPLVGTAQAHVTQVFINGAGLTGGTPNANQAAFRTLAGIDPVYGYPVPAGTTQLRSIPWQGGVNQIALRFDADVAAELQQGDLAIRGVNTPTYTVTNFSYDPATRTGVWTLSAPITLDKVRLFLDDAGLASLDGEWTNNADAYPSGNGTTGGDFDFRLNVLRGDATQDGQVNALDLSLIRQKLNKTATNPGSGGGAYSVFADITADGQINALDISAARQRLNNRLPTAEPASLFGSLPITR